MSANKERGEIAIKIDGEERILKYGWNEIAQLQEKFGEKVDTALNDAIKSFKPGIIAEILVIGLQRNWPEVSVEAIMEISPPIMEASQKIFRAFNLAMFGDETIPDEVQRQMAETPENGVSGKNQKPTGRTTSKRRAGRR